MCATCMPGIQLLEPSSAAFQDLHLQKADIRSSILSLNPETVMRAMGILMGILTARPNAHPQTQIFNKLVKMSSNFNPRNYHHSTQDFLFVLFFTISSSWLSVSRQRMEVLCRLDRLMLMTEAAALQRRKED